MSTKDRLLATAQRRTADLAIDADTFTVREVGATAFARYGELVAAQQRMDGIACLLADTVIDHDTGEPILDLESAMVVAECSRVSMPLINLVMRLSGFTDEKEPDAS